MTRQSFLFVLLIICLASGVFTAFKIASPITPEKLAKRVESQLESSLEKIEAESNRIVNVLKSGRRLPASPYVFVVLTEDELIDWNDYHFIPPVHILTEEFDLKYVKTNNGEFVIKKWRIDTGRWLAAVLPLSIQYKITNNYVTPYWNEDIFDSPDFILSDPSESQGYPIAFNGSVIFKIQITENVSSSSFLWRGLTIFFLALSAGILIALLIKRINSFSVKYPAIGFVGLLVALVVLRFIMIYAEFPARFTDSSLFDPQYFASSELNPSLGDLFLNSIAALILCIYLLKNYYRFGIFRFCFSNSIATNFLSAFSVAAVLFGMLFPFVVVQTIYNNSTLALSITEGIHFDLLRVIALLAVILSWISAFLFMHVFVRLFAHQKKLSYMVLSLVIGSTVFIVINRVSGQTYTWSLLAGLLYLVVIITFSLHTSLRRFQYNTFSYFFVAVVCIALNDMFAVRYFIQQNNLRNQFRFANNVLSERDYFGEYLLHEAAERIASDAFIQNRMASPFLGKEIVQQKIQQVSLSGYFNRYSVNVFLYGVTGDPLRTDDTTTFSGLVKRYDKEAFKTEYDNVYSVTSSEGYFSQKYLAFIPIQKNSSPVGYIIIELLLKRIIPVNVYPELLVDNRFQQAFGADEVSYAIVDNKEIQYSTGNFNYDPFVQNGIGDVLLYTKGIVREKYVHVASEDVNGRIAIVSSATAPIIHWVADFSFNVILGMAIILILVLVQGILSYSFSTNLYLAARIQLMLNLAFFLPLIAVSIITLGLTSRSSQEQLNSEFLNKANSFGSTVAATLTEHKESMDEFVAAFTRVTALANLDANVFDQKGRLVTTSQPLVFENNLLAPYINPSAFSRIIRGDKIFVTTEHVGKLQFYVAYSALTSQETGERLGVLAMPFFQSESSLERMQITILSNILSIFTLIFIVLLVVSFLVTRWLTAPLRMISETMGRISLTRVNKPMHWQSDDEIGLLTREYNQMLINLNDSKQELERNQLERAWREIAQQVAHEIKNPLTPMKLTLQQLERSLQQGDQKDDKLSRAITTLLQQVNSLDDLASSFSSFAKMPEPVMAKVDLVKLLTETISLHSETAKISLQSNLQLADVKADEQLLKRIFSNLILNGIQAARPRVPSEITVRLERVDVKYLVSISDNGKGIDSGLMDKIFLPHFTTKQSGSGLGLAITKQGIEQMGGKIWFESSNEGATFIVELPMNQ